MDLMELKVEIIRNKLTIPKLASAIGMSKKTLYAKLEGRSSFTQPEIVAIKNELHMTDDRMLQIFFTHKVS